MIKPFRFKAKQEWEQETRTGRNKTYFDRNFSFSKKAFGFGLGSLNFNVKLKTDSSYDPYVVIETESQAGNCSILTGFDWSSGSYTY